MGHRPLKEPLGKLYPRAILSSGVEVEEAPRRFSIRDTLDDFDEENRGHIGEEREQNLEQGQREKAKGKMRRGRGQLKKNLGQMRSKAGGTWLIEMSQEGLGSRRKTWAKRRQGQEKSHENYLHTIRTSW